jgi:hypothetical protein
VTGPLDPGARADAAMSLVLAAAGAERRNRPRVFVVLAGVLLLGTGAFALESYRALTRANGAISYQREQTRTVASLVQDIEAMSEQESKLVFPADFRVASKLEDLAKELGLDGVVIEQHDGSPPAGAVNVKKKLYNPRSPIRAIDVGPVIAWLARACDGSVVEGLTPTSIKLTALRTGPTDKPAAPGEADWQLDVKFTRLERDQ